jgi:hypothetical protein
VPQRHRSDQDGKVLGEEALMQRRDKENLPRFRESVRSLISQYLPAGGSIDSELEQLAEKWNPLFDTLNRRNLVDDVNALVRDFVRPVRGSLQMKPPDSERIQALAKQLSTSKSLAKITKKEPLRRYIELYILKSLDQV